jgi:hypothetical protein
VNAIYPLHSSPFWPGSLGSNSIEDRIGIEEKIFCPEASEYELKNEREQQEMVLGVARLGGKGGGEKLKS